MVVGAMIEITWEEVYQRLKLAPAGKLYGIPRGGSVIAGLTGRAVNDPAEADWLVDDIYDSGKTAARWTAKYDKPLWPLISKPNEGIDSWLLMPWETRDPTADLEDTVTRQLEFIGEDPKREGLLNTPARVIRSLTELTAGYKQNPLAILGTTFGEKYDEMVTVRDIDFHSLCEHHLLPFVGKATVSYIPVDRVVGLSKIARLVRCFSERLQVQERLTTEIADAIEQALKPLGVAVHIRATHFCMRLRGVRSTGDLVTTCLLGRFRNRPETRNEFLKSIS
jgi:GTP cyclohydrolase IA